MNAHFMVESLLKLLHGLPATLALSGLAVLLGFGLAAVVAALTLSRNRLAALSARTYVFIFRGTPLLVQVFLIYYGLSQFSEIRQSFAWIILRDPFWCAVLALTLNTAAYSAEIIRGGLQSVPIGQIEAGRAAGMSSLLVFQRIVFPIALRQAIPGYGNEIILILKATSLASTITVVEVTGIAQSLVSETFRVVEVLICAGVIYLSIVFCLILGLRALEYNISQHLRPHRSQGVYLRLSSEPGDS